MIQEEEIDGMFFVAQTTYYIYHNKEARSRGRHFLCTSNEEVFDNYKGTAIIKEMGLLVELANPECADHPLLPNEPMVA